MTAYLFALVLAVFAGLPAIPSTFEAPQTKTAAGLPDDVSGTYTFLKEGEYLQVNLEEGKVTGFVSRFGQLESDKGAFLDHFFDKASLVGNKLKFTTRKVHGVWFEFEGKVGRGEGKTPAEDGYIVLIGTLTEHTTDGAGKASSQSRKATFKSFQLDGDTSPPAPETK